MTYEIKRFDLLSVFKVSFLIYLVLGFLLGLFYGLILMKMIASFSPFMENQMFEGMINISAAGMFFMVVFMAVLMAVIWAVLTVIAAALYNVLTGALGGIKVELAQPPAGYYSQTPPAQNIPPG